MISYTYFDGELTPIPVSWADAVDLKWHKSVATWDCALRDVIWIWCKENFDARTYRIFEEYIPRTTTYSDYQYRFFFLREQDATMCALRWA